MKIDRLLSFLGLCKRAGRLTSGAQTVTNTVNEGKARLVLYAGDVSEKSLRKTLAAAQEMKVPVLRLPCEKEELSFALGKHCGIICITDDGFAGKIPELIN